MQIVSQQNKIIDFESRNMQDHKIIKTKGPKHKEHTQWGHISVMLKKSLLMSSVFRNRNILLSCDRIAWAGLAVSIVNYYGKLFGPT